MLGDRGGLVMRRRRHPCLGRDGLVAVYDALLFLMVIILISVGMFLYSARTGTDSGQFSNDFNQHLAETQLILVEGLSFDQTHPTPAITVEENGSSYEEPLNETMGEVEAQTIGWLVESYFYLHFKDDVNTSLHYGLSELVKLISLFFNITVLEGTHFAWSLTFEGQLLEFSSDIAPNITAIPDDRWAATSEYIGYGAIDFRQGSSGVLYEAELRYYLWYP
jgi:hypothetical protein